MTYFSKQQTHNHSSMLSYTSGHINALLDNTWMACQQHGQTYCMNRQTNGCPFIQC